MPVAQAQRVMDAEGLELALLLPLGCYTEGPSEFFTEPSESLQIGSLEFPAGSTVEPHIHKAKEPGKVYPVVEAILVVRGEGEVDIYDEAGNRVKTLRIVTGDLLICKRGGHGYRFACNLHVLDIRPGPYVDKATDKEMIKWAWTSQP